MSDQLLIVGASVRATACSAHRSGFSVIAVDLFADHDLRTVAETHRITSYEQFETISDRASSCPWMYTGGLENYPNLIERVAKKRMLWGIHGDSLRAIRAPEILAESLASDGIPFPETTQSTSAARSAVWLVKPFRSRGGQGIARVDPRSDPPSLRDNRYMQREITGISCSSVFLANGAKATLVGTCRQLIGQAWAGASDFQFVGAWGPVDLTGRQCEQWRRIGDCLVRHHRLAGIFGIDAIDDGRTIWPIEVNPRYPSSTELLERSLAINAVTAHVHACRDGRLPHVPVVSSAKRWGKAILFAHAETKIPSALRGLVNRLRERPEDHWIADIPWMEQTVAKGHPITTVFASDTDPDRLLSKLQTLARRVYSVL